MIDIETPLEGVLLFEPTVYVDERGFFLERFHASRYLEYGIDLPFVQDNHSRSVKGTLRGLHFQKRSPQGKLVEVVQGRVHTTGGVVRQRRLEAQMMNGEKCQPQIVYRLLTKLPGIDTESHIAGLVS